MAFKVVYASYQLSRIVFKRAAQIRETAEPNENGIADVSNF